MVKFSIEKKNLETATGLLNVVANLKSVGATPSENSGICLTPTTLILSNMNESNGVFIENIPFTVLDGSASTHLEECYMVNTKKLDSMVKGSGKDVIITILEDKIVIGEGKRIFELSMYKTARKTAPETQQLGHSVPLDKVLLNMTYTDAITQNISNRGDLAGTLFTEGGMLASDKISALYIKDSFMFNNEPHQDMVLTTDLFAACASKIKQATAIPAVTVDGTRFVLLFDNIMLCKSIRTDVFPKDGIKRSVTRSQEAAEGKVPNVSAKISVSDFSNKLKEMRSIVEAEDYVIEYQTSGQVLIKSANASQGTGGEELVDAEVVFNGIAASSMSAKFSFLHLDLISRLFSDKETILLISKIENVSKKPVLGNMAILDADRCYVFLPKSSS